MANTSESLGQSPSQPRSGHDRDRGRRRRRDRFATLERLEDRLVLSTFNDLGFRSELKTLTSADGAAAPALEVANLNDEGQAHRLDNPNDQVIAFAAVRPDPSGPGGAIAPVDYEFAVHLSDPTRPGVSDALDKQGTAVFKGRISGSAMPGKADLVVTPDSTTPRIVTVNGSALQVQFAGYQPDSAQPGSGWLQAKVTVAPTSVAQFDQTEIKVQETNGKAIVRATRTGDVTRPATVPYVIEGGTAQPGVDYDAQSGTLEFGARESVKTLTIPIIDNTIGGPDRTVAIRLSDPLPGTSLGPQSRAVVTIVNDDGKAPEPALSVSDVAVDEPAPDRKATADFRVRLSAKFDQPVKVDYQTGDASAIVDKNYRGIQGSLTFAPGETEQTLSVPVLNDNAVAPNLAFVLSLSHPINASLADDQGWATILDSAQPPQFIPASGSSAGDSQPAPVYEPEPSSSAVDPKADAAPNSNSSASSNSSPNPVAETKPKPIAPGSPKPAGSTSSKPVADSSPKAPDSPSIAAPPKPGSIGIVPVLDAPPSAPKPVQAAASGSTVPSESASKPPATFAPSGPITVTSTADDGAGSLRQAIEAANVAPGKDTIVFDIPGSGARTIALTSALPTIVDPVVIDGLSQPGADGRSIVELDGSRTPAGSSGLTIKSGFSVVRGLTINRFPSHGIRLQTQGNNLIENNRIGVSVDGEQALGNGLDGVLIEDSPKNVVGGVAPELGNVISGNGVAGEGAGINIQGSRSSSNAVANNRIGVDADDRQALSNSSFGVFVGFAAQGNAITRNTIAGNGLDRDVRGADVFFSNRDLQGRLLPGARVGASPNILSFNRIGVGADDASLSGGRLKDVIVEPLAQADIRDNMVKPGAEALPETDVSAVPGADSVSAANVRGRAVALAHRRLTQRLRP